MTVEYKSMKRKRRDRKDTGGATPHSRWWLEKDEAVPGILASTIRRIQTDQTALAQMRATCARLYGGMAPSTATGAGFDKLHIVHPSLTGRLTYNVIAIVTDTLMSKMTKNKVRPMFLTQGGDYRLQRRAKKLTQFADGIFYETKFDDLSPESFRDGLLLKEGIVHVFKDWITGRCAIERVMPDELYVDEVDAFYGKPTQIQRVKNIDRQQLIEAFPESADAIRNCKPETGPLAGTGLQMADAIPVVESWHLPSSAELAKGEHCDGEHVIVISNAVLLREKYRKMRFPFAVYRWKPAIYGWHGISLAEELIGDQVEMNHLLIMFQRAFRMTAAFRIAVENGTVPDQHFTDRLGTILHVPKGAMVPQFLTPQALNEQYFEHFDRIKQRAFEKARLTQMSATGAKPAGLDSGEAQRVYHDIEAEGFQYAGHMYEQFHLDVISLAIDVVRDIQEDEGKYELRAPVGSQAMPGQRFLRTIDWKQIAMDEDEYVLKCYPASSLPTSPQGKLASIQELIQAGFLDPATGRKLLDYPDLQQVQTLLGAAEDWIMSVLDEIIEAGSPQKRIRPPDPMMNLQMAETLAMQEFALGAGNNMEPWKLENLRTWIGQVQTWKQKAVAAAAPPAAGPPALAGAPNAGPPGAPPPPGGAMQPGQGMPMAPPTSELRPPPGVQPMAA